MKILHLDLKLVGNNYAEFRYFWDNPNEYQSHQLPLAEITDLIGRAETDYYVYSHVDHAKTGQALYNWLDGSQRNLQRARDQHERQGIVLAIAASARLAHLPWEVLHDGQDFLVERRPAIIPIRWVKDENERQLTIEEQPQNRALNLLFMATSPLGIEPELDFEAEEAQILTATKRKPLSLTVEESGCLEELRCLVEYYDKGHFDVIHLTGHATFQDNQPCFITETEYGEPEYSSAEDIADRLQFQLPKLIFLSGCRTGYSRDEGIIPSMAEALLNQGATAVLGWGQKVLDTDASTAASSLYKELSAGKSLLEAVALTYQALLKNKARDWHILRLYVAGKIPGALVTPLVTRGRKPVPPPSITPEYIDPETKSLRVASRKEFVGRRRQLQNCLRTLKTDDDKVGVLIHGFGGLGKSTIAARLCDRFSTREKVVVLWRQIDESTLVKRLADKLRNSEQRTALKESQEELKYRLRYLFYELNEAGEKPFLFVLDDFEWNLEPRQGRYILKTEVAEILEALVWAVQEANSRNRIIITCRYDFDSDLLGLFYKQPLEAFRKSDLQKKLNRLEAFNSEKIDKGLVKKALQLADGNPRLLEWLNDEVLLKEEANSRLSELESNPEEWKREIIREELCEQIDKTLEKILSHCLAFEIPVPWPALEAVCESISGYKEQLSRAVELGLVEVSPKPDESQRVYRVSRILPHIIPGICLPQEPEVYYLYQKASEKLHELWGNRGNISLEKWREIFRLVFTDKDNPDRFRQGFSWMLEVQYNREADIALEIELIEVSSELSGAHLFRQLEVYLQQEKWREADEETAWIFYLVMIIREYKDWWELFKKFPSQTLNEIDRLWVSYSEGHFGFSVQKCIWKSLGGNSERDDETWKTFKKQVGWDVQGKWREDHTMLCKSESNEGNLPALIYTRRGNSGGFCVDFYPVEEWFSSLRFKPDP
ncbi:CHAT domain-containing protein [Lyngbya aestuarii]|uniref:CHAT domain-containing protein n=1 Tax=Lyngbya aestuarii TaxID=118322 RepID=UPI00403DDA30